MTRPLPVTILAIAALALAGCTHDPRATAAPQAAAVRQSAAVVSAEADAADADLAAAETGTAAIAADPQATPAIQSTAADAHAKVKSGRAHVRRIRKQTPVITRGADNLEATVARAVDANLAPYRRLAFWTVVVTALAVGFLWWTEKPRYAVAVLAVGGTVYAFARVAGWEQQHPWAVPGLIGAAAVVVAAVEWVRHPESVRSILAGLKAAKGT